MADHDRSPAGSAPRQLSDLRSAKESNLTSAKDVVWHKIRQSIISLEYAPGMPLREAGLSSLYGVSKTPIREALVRLEKEGLVEISKFRGAQVRGYTLRDVREIYEVRELLEGFCASEAAARISPADEEALRRNIALSRRLSTGGNIDEIAKAFDEFDQLLYRQVESHRIAPILEDLAAHLDRLGRLTVKVAGRVEASVDQHEKIVMAIGRRDLAGAEAACRSHVRSVANDVLDRIGHDWCSGMSGDF